VGLGINLGAIFLFRPGKRRVARAEAGFHMSKRHFGRSRGTRAAKRARRIALHDQQVWSRVGQHWLKRAGDPRDMGMRVFFAGASEIDCRVGIEAVVGEVKPGMLAGDDQRRNEPARCQRVGHGSEFYGFWSGADDQPDVGRTQPSP